MHLSSNTHTLLHLSLRSSTVHSLSRYHNSRLRVSGRCYRGSRHPLQLLGTGGLSQCAEGPPHPLSPGRHHLRDLGGLRALEAHLVSRAQAVPASTPPQAVNRGRRKTAVPHAASFQRHRAVRRSHPVRMGWGWRKTCELCRQYPSHSNNRKRFKQPISCSL